MERAGQDDAVRHRFSPSFPIHGKAMLLIFDTKLLKHFEDTAAQLSRRGAISVACMEPELFLDKLRDSGAQAVDEFDMVLISIPIEGSGSRLKETMVEDVDETLPFSVHMSKHLTLAKVPIPCVAIARHREDGSSVLDGSFRLVLNEPLQMAELEALINREELFETYDVDLSIGTDDAAAAAAEIDPLDSSVVQREQRKRLITRASEMQRLREHDDASRVAGLVQWATLEGITVPQTAHPDALPYVCRARARACVCVRGVADDVFVSSFDSRRRGVVRCMVCVWFHTCVD